MNKWTENILLGHNILTDIDINIKLPNL